MPDITLNGVTFPLKDEPPKGGLMVDFFMDLETNNPGLRMAAMGRLVLALVDKDVDPKEVRAQIRELDHAEIETAITDAIYAYGADPSSAGQESSSVSSDGSPAGERMSRVVSFSKGTVEQEPQSSTG